MPLLWLSLAFITGIWFASLVPFAAGLGFGICVAATFGASMLNLLRKNFREAHTNHTILKKANEIIGATFPQGYFIPFLLLLIGAAGLGAGRYQGHIPLIQQSNYVAAYCNPDERIYLTGQVKKPPDVRDGHTLLWIEATSIRYPKKITHTSVRGQVLARVEDGEYAYGDDLVLYGYLTEPSAQPGSPYRDYLTRQGIHAMMEYPKAGVLARDQGSAIMGSIYGLRTNALRIVYRVFPDPEASLLAGILLGVETGISKNVARAFQITGTGHIIAISGFNMAIIATLGTMLFTRWLGRWVGSIIAILMVGSYATLVGADPAVVRAAIMGILAVIGRRLNRPGVALNTLAITAAAMTFHTPTIPWEAGFQLSFAATSGLVIYGEPWGRWFKNLLARWMPEGMVQSIARPVSEYLLLTMAAQLAVTPVLLYHFRQLSLSALLANFMILPAQPLVMGLGGVTTITGLGMLPLAETISPIMVLPTTYTVRVVEWLAEIPNSVLFTGDFHPYMIFGMYAVLFGGTFAWFQWKKAREWIWPGKWLHSPVVLVGLVLITAFVWRAAVVRPDGRLHLIMLDVGTGEAILVRTPGGKNILINGGPSEIALSEGLGRWMPPGIHTLDALIVANTQSHHLAGLPANLERFPPDVVFWSGNAAASNSARRVLDTLRQYEIVVEDLVIGQRVGLEDDLFLNVLALNKQGSILSLEYQGFHMLLPSGMTPDTLSQIQFNENSPLHVYMLAQGGHASVNPAALLNSLNPQLAVLSVAPGDRNGLPHPETLSALESVPLVRTDRDGWIHITTDGASMWVEVQRDKK